MTKLMLVSLVVLLLEAMSVFGCGTPGSPTNCADRGVVLGHAKRIAKEMERDVTSLDSVVVRTDKAIGFMVARGIKELRKKGYDNDASHYEERFNEEFRGFLLRRDIGSHKPLVQFLADFYDRLEMVLGIALCKNLHLSDIKTINFCIPVVFAPCTFDMGFVSGTRQDEYKRHFAEGAFYWGLLPVVTYWIVDIAIISGTSGIGTFLAGPVASAVEVLTGKYIYPKLSDKIFTRSCN